MTIDHSNFTEDMALQFDKETNDKARIPSAIGYLFFFVPLVMNPDSKFARYHSNQSLILMLLLFLGGSALSAIPYAGFFLLLLMLLFCFICLIRGIVLALSGKAKRIPFFGKLVIIEFDEMYKIDV